MAYEEQVKYLIEETDCGPDWSNELSIKVLRNPFNIKSIVFKQGSNIVVFKEDQVSDLLKIVQSLG